MKKVLVFGGYGNFGKIISRSLLKDRIPVIICGRNQSKLKIQQTQLKKQFGDQLIQADIKDINDTNLSAYLSESKPALLINTCGPFQNANYQIVQDCIQNKIDYVDLADGRDFVTKMKAQFQQKARQNGVTVITGASSVPGLSSAIIEQFKDQFQTIQKAQYGISPGQKTTRGGLATVKAVLGYIGKPIRSYDNLKKPVYGWQDLYQQNYPTLGTRLMGNCQVPDLDLFPEKYGIKNVKFSAGMESKLLHYAIWATSWLIRAGLPLNLPKYSQFLLNVSHKGFDWLGTSDGGLHMTLVGKNHSQQKIQRKWYIIIRNGHGPNVPVAPAIILSKKLINQSLRLPGVNPCVGLVTLKQYLAQLQEYNVQTFTTKSII